MENRIFENNPLQPETVTNEIPAKPQDDTAARKSKANLLCYISLSLFIATILLFTGTFHVIHNASPYLSLMSFAGTPPITL